MGIEKNKKIAKKKNLMDQFEKFTLYYIKKNNRNKKTPNVFYC